VLIRAEVIIQAILGIETWHWQAP